MIEANDHAAAAAALIVTSAAVSKTMPHATQTLA